MTQTASTLATLSLLCLVVVSLLTAPARCATGGATFSPGLFSEGPPEFPETAGSAHIGDGVSDGPDKNRLIKKVFGDARYSISSCTNASRTVRIDVQRVNKEYDIAYGGNIDGVASEVLRRAILFAWKNCNANRNGDPYFIDSASMYLPSGEEIYRADGLRNNVQRPGPFTGKNLYIAYGWANFHDIRNEKAGERYERERKEWWESFWFNLKALFWLVVVGAIVGLFLWNWEAFARLYYQLTPHPAASMVNDAIRAGVEFDEQAFADMVREPTASRVGQDVRNAQAAKLAEMARASNEQLRRIAEELQVQLEEQARYQAAQGRGVDDGMAEQVAKARADEYAKAKEFWESRRKT